jgi:hypothetical protein
MPVKQRIHNAEFKAHLVFDLGSNLFLALIQRQRRQLYLFDCQIFLLTQQMVELWGAVDFFEN